MNFLVDPKLTTECQKFRELSNFQFFNFQAFQEIFRELELPKSSEAKEPAIQVAFLKRNLKSSDEKGPQYDPKISKNQQHLNFLNFARFFTVSESFCGLYF